MRAWIWALGVLAGCNGDKGGSGDGDVETGAPDTAEPDDTDTPPDDTGPAPCAAELAATSPAENAPDAPLDAAFTATFTSPDPDATVALADTDGNPVPGVSSWSEDGLTLTFVPDAWFAPESRYTADIQWCTGETAVTFFTNDGEGLPPDPATIEGASYRLDLKEGTWTEPGLLGTFMSTQIAVALMVQVQGVGEDSVGLRVAFTDVDAEYQDVCQQTQDVSAGYSAPDLAYGPADFSIPYGEYWTFYLHELTLTGSFAYDGEEIAGLTLEAVADAREAVDLVEEQLGLESPDEMCELIVDFGAKCEPCADGEVYCVPVRVEDVPALRVDAVLDEVPSPGCHPGCPYGDYPECL